MALLAGASLVGCAAPGDASLDEAVDAVEAEEQQAFDEGSTPSTPSQGDSGQTCEIKIPPSMSCNAKLAPGVERTCSINGRQMIVRAGKTMNPCKPTGLVIDLHGQGGNMKQARGGERYCYFGLCWDGPGSGWAAESDAPGAGFVTVFPQANAGGWSRGDDNFLVKVVEEVKKVANIDPSKVLLTGVSESANYVTQLGCARSDVFRGLTLHAGGVNCGNVRKPVSTILFSSPADLFHLGSVNAVESVARANRCRGDAKPWKIIDASTADALCRSAQSDPKATLAACNALAGVKPQPTLCKIWDQCAEGTKVVSCEVPASNPHGALNAAFDARVIYENATRLNTPSLAWRFFNGL